MFDILASIKDDHKLTLNHWRYRLLHWFFNIDPGIVEESCLPRAFYTHYCPLFHVTNLIFIFSPLIFIYKLIWSISSLIIGYFKRILNVISVILNSVLIEIEKLIPRRKKQVKVDEVKEETTLDKVLKRARKQLEQAKKIAEKSDRAKLLPKLTSFISNNSTANDFDLFWSSNSKEFVEIGYKEVQQLWDKSFEKIKIKKEKEEALRKRIKEQMAFWCSFSRIFIKGILNIIYVALAIFVCYLVYLFTIPTLMILASTISACKNLFVSMMEINYLKLFTDIIVGTINIVIRLAVACGLLYGSYRLIKLIPFVGILKKACFPFELGTQMCCALIEYISGMVKGVVHFVSMFYEENCPAIVIIDDESEI